MQKRRVKSSLPFCQKRKSERSKRVFASFSRKKRKLNKRAKTEACVGCLLKTSLTEPVFTCPECSFIKGISEGTMRDDAFICKTCNDLPAGKRLLNLFKKKGFIIGKSIKGSNRHSRTVLAFLRKVENASKNAGDPNIIYGTEEG